MIDKLLLLSGAEVPFLKGGISIHQPTLKEISMINESAFLYGSRSLVFSKDNLPEKDKVGLEDKSDFDIFMSMMNRKDFKKFRSSVMLVLMLLFPSFAIELKENNIAIKNENNSTEINAENYEELKELLSDIFCYSFGGEPNKGYNPQKGRAEKIAEKLKKGKEKVAKQKNIQIENLSIYESQASALAIGLNLDINVIMSYTLYQLNDQYIRYIKKYEYDTYVQAKMAGATGMKEVKDWMGDLQLKK